MLILHPTFHIPFFMTLVQTELQMLEIDMGQTRWSCGCRSVLLLGVPGFASRLFQDPRVVMLLLRKHITQSIPPPHGSSGLAGRFESLRLLRVARNPQSRNNLLTFNIYFISPPKAPGRGGLSFPRAWVVGGAQNQRLCQCPSSQSMGLRRLCCNYICIIKVLIRVHLKSGIY